MPGVLRGASDVAFKRKRTQHRSMAFQWTRSTTLLGDLLNTIRGWFETPEPPTIFHVTHFKAGSQWINRIFHNLVYDKIVLPLVEGNVINVQFLHRPIQAGKVYPTVYVTRDEFESVVLPRNSRRFVVIRDARDTLVSAYFSIKFSHAMSEQEDLQMRAKLLECGIDEGLLYLMNEWLPGKVIAIQESWLGGPDDLIKYEDLLTRDEEILERVLIDHCQLPVERKKFRETIIANRFEMQAGRKRGVENTQSHERKGIAGDWHNHFSDKVAKTFKERYGELLVATGYESNDRW